MKLHSNVSSQRRILRPRPESRNREGGAILAISRSKGCVQSAYWAGGVYFQEMVSAGTPDPPAKTGETQG